MLAGIPGITYELILINDGSSDESSAEMDKVEGLHIRRINKRNGGLGSVLQIGFNRAQGDVVIYLDLDLSYGVENLAKIIYLSSRWDCVVCSKYKSVNNYPLLRRAASGIHAFITAFLFRIPVRDTGSGMVLIRRDFIKNLQFKSRRFGIHLELFLLLMQQKAGIKEVAVRYIHKPGSFRFFTHGFQTVKELFTLLYFYKIV